MEEELDLKSILKTFWDQKILIISITTVFALSSIYSTLNTPNEYKAVLKIIPAEGSAGSKSSGLAAQFGGLAGLAGLGGKSTTPEDVIALEIMQSWSFIENFIQENDLEVELFAARGWNPETNELVIDPNTYDIKAGKWLSKPPTSWQLYELFLDRLSIQPQRDSNIINISYEHFSPLSSKEYIELLLEDINNYMRLRQIEISSNNILYLESQIQKTKMSEMKSVFYNLIEEQTKTKMLAEANKDYVFLTINRAMVPEQKSKPFRSLIVIQTTLIGGLISLIIALFLHIFIRRK